MVRNAVDHGIEGRAERLAAGKDPTAQLLLSAAHQGGNLVITVRDDGRGIDADKIVAKAIEKGVLRKGQQLDRQAALHLIFAPGFSTKSDVSDISGRGVGLDVVKTNIEKVLRGEVQIETEPGRGTTFRVVLPLTLAIIDGMVVRSNGERYVVPLTHVHESVKPKAKDVHFATGLGEVLHLRGESLPLHKLSQLLDSKGSRGGELETTAIVVRTGSRPFSVLVDEIIGHQQVVIKKLWDEIGNIRGISGGAILGDGHAALILDLNELVSKGSTRDVQRSSSRGAA
jgi:two-component system chemotaxis sensor kinase CheA